MDYLRISAALFVFRLTLSSHAQYGDLHNFDGNTFDLY